MPTARAVRALLEGAGMMRLRIEALQPLGRALMLPIAVLPVAGLLLRLGQPDMLNIAFIAAAGEAIFSNLGLIFAIGVAVGLARENNGAAGLAGAVAYLVTVEGGKALLPSRPRRGRRLCRPGDPRSRHRGVEGQGAGQAQRARRHPVGADRGLALQSLFGIKLPDYLAFFGGRRFVPIAAGLPG
jgi:PTS system N-acetylglucosamine-specific IIC component